MKYFKIIQNKNIIDLLHYDEKIGPTYIKFQKTHGIPLRCNVSEAQGILSDNEKIYNTSSFLSFPVPDMYPTVTLVEISEAEFDIIKDKSFKTTQEIREELLIEILERGF